MIMKKIYKQIFWMILTFFLSSILLMSCGGDSMQGMIIVTQVAPTGIKIDYLTGGNWRFTGKSRIVAIDPSRPGVVAKVLTDGFYAARSPEISFDGKRMLFAAQKQQGDAWQIYEMILGKDQTRLVINMNNNCTDPAYLPDDKIIFSRMKSDISSASGSTLYTCGLTGCCLTPVTFHPGSDFASSMLNDGREVIISWPVYPKTEAPEYLVLRPDGTKMELYYKGEAGNWLNGKIRETDDGHIVFTESTGPGLSHGRLISLKQSRPLSSRSDISGNAAGSFYSVFPEKDGKFLVSYRDNDSGLYGIYQYDPVQEKIGKLILQDKNYNCIEPVIAGTHQRPKDLPTEVNMDSKSALLMCMNSDFSTLPPDPASGKDQKAKFVRIIGLKGLLSEVPVEDDGSFYVDISSDVPVQFETVNAEGKLLRGPSSWVWMRPNERRGCIGCHENREMAPENRVALAIKKMPVKVLVSGTSQAVADSKGLKNKD